MIALLAILCALLAVSIVVNVFLAVAWRELHTSARGVIRSAERLARRGDS
jgi:hypothetical protein